MNGKQSWLPAQLTGTARRDFRVRNQGTGGLSGSAALGLGFRSKFPPSGHQIPPSSRQGAVLNDLQGLTGWRLCRTGTVSSGAIHLGSRLGLLLLAVPPVQWLISLALISLTIEGEP